MNYEYVTGKEVLAKLFAARATRQSAALYCFDVIAAQPFAPVDLEFKDEQGRVMCTRIFGRTVVTYTVDHAAKEIQIVDLGWTD